MKANKILVSLLTLVLTIALMFSLFSVSVFAHDDHEDESTTTNSSTTETTDDHDHDHEEEEENKLVETIISLSIVGVVLIAVAVYCIVKREKVGKFLRAIKSEMKKIVWFSWKDTRKNSVVVIIVVIVISILIGVLDLAFNQGIELLKKLFS